MRIITTILSLIIIAFVAGIFSGRIDVIIWSKDEATEAFVASYGKARLQKEDGTVYIWANGRWNYVK